MSLQQLRQRFLGLYIGVLGSKYWTASMTPGGNWMVKVWGTSPFYGKKSATWIFTTISKKQKTKKNKKTKKGGGDFIKRKSMQGNTATIRRDGFRKHFGHHCSGYNKDRLHTTEQECHQMTTAQWHDMTLSDWHDERWQWTACHERHVTYQQSLKQRKHNKLCQVHWTRASNQKKGTVHRT